LNEKKFSIKAHQHWDYAKTNLDRDLQKSGNNECVPLSNVGEGIQTFNSFQELAESQNDQNESIGES
jgi:hypothetical protein